MKNLECAGSAFVSLALCILTPISIYAQNTVYFSTSDAGEIKAMTEWGADTAWPSTDNMRHAIDHMGADQIDVIRLNFYTDEALDANGEIGSNSKARIDNQLSIAAMAGDKPLALTPSSGEATNSWYLNGADEVWVDRWVALMEATQEYIGKPIAELEPFNEPDYWDGQGTPQNLYDILVALQSSSNFSGTKLVAASTLNSDNAQWWYDQIAGPVTHGSTHQLAGSANSYVNFIQHVIANGDAAYNPEIHSMAETLYGCEYGLSGAIWWGAVLRDRGVLVQSVQGARLGYAENRANYSAGAVYRHPDGELYGFAGCFERHGPQHYYRFVCSNQDVYYNGVGPIREYMLITYADAFGGYARIDTSPGFPALDGHRWKIVNRAGGEVMEVQSAGTSDGANIRTATGTDALHQKWDIVRKKGGYYNLFNANSGKTAEVANWSLSNGGNVQQWGEGQNATQEWFIEEAGGGYYHIRNAHSNKYLDADAGSDNIIQWEYNGGLNQQWQFVLADPAVSGSLLAHYAFEGNANDSAGSNNGSTTGSPAYTTGQIGQAIDLDGANDYVTLPSGVASSADITIAAWVNWDGGGDWQRIFDFGNDTDSYLFLTPATGGEMRFAITTGSNTEEQLLATDSLPTGEWHHVAVTLDGNTGVMYIDGAPRVAGQILLNPSDINPVNNYIGQSQWPDPLFNGRIDDFRIYDYALSSSQILALVDACPQNNPAFFVADPIRKAAASGDSAYLSTIAGDAFDPDGDSLTFSKTTGPAWLEVASDGTLFGAPGTDDLGENSFTVRVTDGDGAYDEATLQIKVNGLYAHYEFENDTTDSIGSNDGVPTGSPAYIANGIGQSISLDGVDDLITLPSGVADFDDITISAWVFWDGGDQWQRIFDFGNDTDEYMFLTPRSGGDALHFGITVGGYGVEQTLDATQLTTGQWTHVAVTLNGNTGVLYVNGAAVDANASMTLDPADFNPSVNYIGASQFSDPLFGGNIDDFRIYNYAMSASEISGLYENNPANTPPSFSSDPIIKAAATEDRTYTGQTLAGDASDPDLGDTLTFSKISGPVWLNVAGNGALSGTPSASDLGGNDFIVEVNDGNGGSDQATLTILVVTIGSSAADFWLLY